VIYIAQKVKCPYCGQQDTKDNLVQVGRRYWHQECIEQNEADKSEEDLIIERDKRERKQLIQYICELYQTKNPNPRIMKQIKQFHEENEYRYFAIQLALEYFYIIKDNPIKTTATIGIVPYVMEDAQNYYRRIASIQQQNEVDIEIQKVFIKSPQATVNRRKKYINMEEL